VAVVGLVLGDEDQIWVTVELLEVGNAWLDLLARDGEGRVEDYRGPDEPGIDEYVECPGRGRERRVGRGRE
jgi:hypothetical protein